MNRKGFLAVLVFLFLVSASEWMPATAQSAEQEVRKAESDRFAAMLKGDMAALERLLAPELIYTHGDGRVVDKAAFIADLKTGDFKVRQHRRRQFEGAHIWRYRNRQWCCRHERRQQRGPGQDTNRLLDDTTAAERILADDFMARNAAGTVGSRKVRHWFLVLRSAVLGFWFLVLGANVLAQRGASPPSQMRTATTYELTDGRTITGTPVGQPAADDIQLRTNEGKILLLRLSTDSRRSGPVEGRKSSARYRVVTSTVDWPSYDGGHQCDRHQRMVRRVRSW